MRGFAQTSRAAPRRLAAIAAACAMLASAPSAAQESQGFAVYAAWFDRSLEGVALRADLSAGREDLMRQLLHSGFAVRLSFEARLRRARDWLPDRRVGEFFWNPEITYDSLLDRYTFRAGDAPPEEFDSLSAALARASRLRSIPSDSPDLIAALAQSGLYLDARYGMDIGHLPQLLQVSLLAGDWNIDSGWRRLRLGNS